MIIGGGIRQMQLIEAAKKENYYLIVCDQTESCMGAGLADKFYKVDILNLPGLLEVAKKEQIDGVISNSELAMSNVAAISCEMKVIGNSIESVETLQSKSLFRKLQKECGVCSPKYYEIKDFNEMEAYWSTLHYPIIIKPSESSGTRGTTRFDHANQLEKMREAFDRCKAFSRNDYVTVEEFIEMPSLDVIESDILLYKGEILWEGTMRTRRSESLPMVPMTYSLPSGFDEASMKKFQEVVAKLLHEAGIVHGQFNVEAYFTAENDLFVIEINARQGGNDIPGFIKNHSGIDMNRLLVTTVVDDGYYFEEVKEMKKKNVYCVKHMVMAKQDGIYKGIQIDESIKKNVIATRDVIKQNDRIRIVGDSSDSVCEVNMIFEDEKSQKEASEQMELLIKPVIV